MEPTNGRNFGRIAAITLLTLGCLYVMAPFLAAILFAACVVISSWPLYERLLARCRQRHMLAASTMTLTLTLLVLIPIALVGYHLADNVTRLFEQLRLIIDTGDIAPPVWIRNIPIVGTYIDNYLNELIGSREQMMALGKRMLEPGRHYLAVSGIVLGTGIAQMALAAFVAFFLYRDGMTLLRAIAVVMGRVMGENAPHILRTVSQTVPSRPYMTPRWALPLPACRACRCCQCWCSCCRWCRWARRWCGAGRRCGCSAMAKTAGAFSC
jgi:predicted PurR-regulated permease PerM